MKKLILLAALGILALSPTLWAGITVTSPNASSEWCIGSPYTVTWTSSDVTGNVDVILRTTDNSAPPVLGIAANTANDGTESWTIPASVAPGTYLVRIRSISDPTVYDDSPAFEIKNCAAASITVTAPNARSSWCINNPYTVTWTSSGVTGNVDVILRTTDNSAPPVLGIAANTANDGSERWTIPASVAPGTYLIRIRSVSDPNVFDDSAEFRIMSCIVGVVLDLTLPDLALERIYYSDRNGGQIVARVRNSGELDVDQSVGFAFVLIGSRGGFAPTTKRINLDHGEVRDYDIYHLGPESMPASGLQIRVNLDWENHIAETNERNNEQETRLCGLDISLQAPRSELSLHRLYAMGGEDYRIEFKIRVRHNLPQTVRNIRVYWDLIRVSSGEILRSYDHTIESLGSGAEHVWSVNETYGKSGRDRSKRPRLTEGANYRIVARISDPHDDFCDVNDGNDQASFSFTIGDTPF